MTRSSAAAGPNGPLLLRRATVVTMDPAARVYRPGEVLVEEGRIAAVGSRVEVPAGSLRVDLDGCVLLPGLVQAHVHLGQTFFRGLAEGRALMPWLRERIWPLEAAHTDESAYWCTLLGAAECLLSGTTAIQEIGLGPGIRGLLEALASCGLRSVAGMCLMDEIEALPPGLAAPTAEVLRRTVELGEEFDDREDGLLRYSLNPRFILSATDELWRQIRELSLGRSWPIHTHALEHPEETEAVRTSKNGSDEIEYFLAAGVLDTDLRIAHGVQLDSERLAMLAGRRLAVAHCPSANLRLGSGIADVVGLRAAGIPVGVGCDGAACNNDLDCLEEARLAALLQQLRHGPAACDGLTALRLATSEGARVIGLGDEIGSLEAGKRADLVVLDTSRPEWSAADACDVHDLVAFVGSRAAVLHVMVEGRWRVWDRGLTELDLGQIQRRSARSRRELLGRSRLAV